MATKAIQGAIYGGNALLRHLGEIEARLGKGAHARIGFLADAVYPEKKGRKALPVAQVAFWNEYGTNPKKGPKIPSRPFFRTMIANKSPRWGVSLGNILRAQKYDAHRSLTEMADGIKGQLQMSINNWTTPPNAPRTAAKPPVGKGFNKPLIHTGWMLNNVDYQVVEGQDAEGDE